MIRVNGVPLDNAALGWIFRPKSVPYSNLEADLGQLAVAGRDGTVATTTTVHAPLYPLTVNTAPSGWAPLLALFGAKKLVLTRDDRPEVEIPVRFVSSAVDRVFPRNEWIDATFIVELTGAFWRDKQPSTVAAALSSASVPVKVFGNKPRAGAVPTVNLFTNPGFETASGTVVVKTNYATSPYGQVALPKYGVAANSIVNVGNFAGATAPPEGPSNGIALTIPAGLAGGGVFLNDPLLSAGTYVASLWVCRMSGVGITMGLAQAGVGSNAPQAFTFNQWTKISWQFEVTAAQAGTSASRIGFRQQGVLSDVDALFYLTGFEVAPLGQESSPVVSGDTAHLDPNLTTAWVSTPNASPSILTGVAVANIANHAGVTLAPYQVTVPGGKAARHTLRSTVAIALSAGTASTVSGRVYTMLIRARASRPTQVRTRINGTSDADYTLTSEWKDLRTTIAVGTPSSLSTGLYVHPDASRPYGTTIDIDDALLVDGVYTGPGFSGSSEDTPTVVYQWDGPPDASTSSAWLRSDILGGLSAPVQDAVIRVKGAATGIQITDASGAWVTLPNVTSSEWVRFEADTGRAFKTTTDVWTGGTDVSGLVDFGGPRGVFEITPVLAPLDPSTREGVLTVTTATRSGAVVEVRGKAAYAI